MEIARDKIAEWIKSLEAAFREDRDARETLKSLKIPGCTQLNLSRIG
jgi:hypothetical protein